MFHNFRCPCFLLDPRLQSGLSTCLKWEPRSRLGIYVGNSPDHAGTVALVLNPRTGHVSPQFHIVFNDLFTAVPFMNKSQLLPNWAELVKDSRELVKDKRFHLEKTWLFPSADSGDDVLIPEPIPVIQQSAATATSEPIVTPTAPAISPPIDFLTNNPARFPVCEGYYVHSSTNELEAPEIINLATSGLRGSKQIKSITKQNNDGPTIMAYTSSINKKGIFNRPKRNIPILAFFSVFCAIGALWSFATSQIPHFHNDACHSFTSRLSNYYERINVLFHDTMNDLCHQFKSYNTSNEAYTYKHIPQEKDCKELFKAMLEEIEVHEKR